MWLFAVVALELKYRAPHAHTMLECVEVRWGTAAHIVSAQSLNRCWQLLEQRPVRHATAYSCLAELHMGLRGTQHEPSAFSAAAPGTWQSIACLGCLSEAKQAAVYATCSSHPGLSVHRE